jgi:ribosomal-protein-alanine N-acetyltransferase
VESCHRLWHNIEKKKGNGVPMAVILETERLLFRDHEPQDLEPFCAMEADPEVRRYVGGAPRSRAGAESKFYSVYLQPVSDRLALWATVYKPRGCYIGYCGVYPRFDGGGTPIPGEGVLAFYLARAYWGQGLGTEAGRAFLRFGFEELSLSRIVASVQVGNDTSARVLKKLGLARVGTDVGERRSYDHYALTRTAWERMAAG